ncbi:MAG: hypothetical protein ABSH19_06495, partial [Opitutales bacterium]
EATYYTAAQIDAFLNGVVRVLNLVGLTGSGETLASQNTSGTLGQVYLVIIPGLPLRQWKVVSSTAATNLTSDPAIVQGADFNATSNPTVFQSLD